MAKYTEQLTAFLRKFFPAKVCENDYGHGYEARQLVNGQWVLWVDGKGCDLVSPGYAWPPGDRYFTDCMGSRKQIDRSAKEIMSVRGVFK